MYWLLILLLVCPGDLNGDGAVDPLDLGVLTAHTGCGVGKDDPLCDACDLNSDGTIDPLDFGALSSIYGPCVAESNAECIGDTNGDGKVDPLDIGAICSHFGCEVMKDDPVCNNADVNNDGVVDPLDLGTIQTYLGVCITEKPVQTPLPPPPDLATAKSLPVRHYTWNWKVSTLSDSAQSTRIFEWTRITRSVTVSLDWSNKDTVEAAINYCNLANLAEPDAPECQLGLQLSGWYDVSCGFAGPGYCDGSDPCDLSSHQKYLDWLDDRLTLMRTWINEVNGETGTIKVGAVWMDNELWSTKTINEPQKACRLEKHYAILTKVQEYYPDIPVTFYGRGAIDTFNSTAKDGNTNYNWSKDRYFDHTEDGEFFKWAAPVIYYCNTDTYEFGMILDYVRDTCPGAKTYGQYVWTGLTGGKGETQYVKNGVTTDETTEALAKYLSTRDEVRSVLFYPGPDDTYVPFEEADARLLAYSKGWGQP